MLLQALLIAGLVQVPHVEDDRWTQDYVAAAERAAAESKDLLLDFTGSDWCTWCIRLHREVFEQAEFDPTWAHYVAVTVDFPTDESVLPPGVKQQNEGLRQRLPVDGFPTIYLCDSKGRPYGKTGYREGGPAPYAEHLAALRLVREVRDAAWAAADETKGVARAERLDQGLDVLPRAMLFPHYDDVALEALQLDPEDSLGLVLKYELLRDAKQLNQARTALELQVGDLAATKNWQGLVQAMDAAVLRYRALKELGQFALMFKAVGQLEQGALKPGLETLLAARARDPKGSLVGRVDKMIVQVREVLGESDF
ncbi:MAG: thioredoxin family protein [Planctomycetota bacterium]|nr:thioredoxin family protein [Planctomycetota bacterium]